MTGAPAAARTWLRASAVFLVAVAAAGNISHGAEFLSANGQGMFLAAVGSVSPDILLLSTTIRLRYDRRHGWAWAGLLASTGFVLWAGVATAGAGFTAKAVSGWPVMVAVLAAGLMETEVGVPAGEGYTLERTPDPIEATGVIEARSIEATSIPDPIDPIAIDPDPVVDPIAIGGPWLPAEPTPIVDPPTPIVEAPIAGSARSIEALHEELAASIAAGQLPAKPSAEAIRKTLKVSPARARVLREGVLA